MFDIGLLEMALIGVIGLLVVGPDRLVKLAQKAGYYVRRMRHFVGHMQNEFQSELEPDTLKKHLALEDENKEIVEIVKEVKGIKKGVEADKK